MRRYRGRFGIAFVLSAYCAAACSSTHSLAPSTDAGLSDSGGEDSGPPVCRIPESPMVDAGLDGAACGDVPTTIVRETCVGGICHHAGPVQAAHLNLLSPCVADRLVGVVSSCNGRLLVDPADPARSFILEKLEQQKPECGGATMPYANHLPARELACVKAWVFAIAEGK